MKYCKLKNENVRVQREQCEAWCTNETSLTVNSDAWKECVGSSDSVNAKVKEEKIGMSEEKFKQQQNEKKNAKERDNKKKVKASVLTPLATEPIE